MADNNQAMPHVASVFSFVHEYAQTLHFAGEALQA